MCRVTSLRILPHGICLTTEEKALKNLSQGTVYILPKHPHITKPTHTHTHTHYKTDLCKHTHTHTLQNPLIHTQTHALKNNTKQPPNKLRQRQCKIYLNEIVTYNQCPQYKFTLTHRAPLSTRTSPLVTSPPHFNSLACNCTLAPLSKCVQFTGERCQ